MAHLKSCHGGWNNLITQNGAEHVAVSLGKAKARKR